MAETTVKERPILFSSPMVRAILDGRKTQTRRIMKPQPEIGIPDEHIAWTAWNESWSTHDSRDPDPSVVDEWMCPYGYVGQHLWVRETWGMVRYCLPQSTNTKGAPQKLVYAAGDPVEKPVKWKPSIHMRREYSRITLEITGVRVERLQDISHEDALAEGIQSTRFATEPLELRDQSLTLAQLAFSYLWESINGPGSWDANPFVWVIEFRRLESPQ